QGCTYPGATNYDAGSTADDGSCEFDLEEVVVSTCDGDADGDGQVSTEEFVAFAEKQAAEEDDMGPRSMTAGIHESERPR
ncbi:MAG: hypothetical protein ACPIOQ_78610, partial [Promethearchaeia archaeon]